MISRIRIENLKCFDDINLDLENFNLLVGMNSAGKTTVIQSLLLSIQNITYKGRSPLNGQLVSLGDFSDARNVVKNAKSFLITLYSEANKYIEQKFAEENDNVLYSIISHGGDHLIEFLDQKNKRIRYISSKRLGSQDLYLNNFDQYNDIGVFGEYAIDYFDKNKSNPIEMDFIKDKAIGLTLERQLNYWLKYILNSELLTEDINGTDQVRAQFRYLTNRYVRPKNIGSGLSYVISLLISSLTSKINDLIIIENPEIHLHPRAQSRLAEFLTFIADKGVKFIIETHSDHIFNGMRKAIKKGTISTNYVATYYFNINEETLISQPVKIKIDENGNVLNHQEGLFDQFDDDLDELLGLR